MYLCALHESKVILNLPLIPKDVLFDIFLVCFFFNIILPDLSANILHCFVFYIFIGED